MFSLLITDSRGPVWVANAMSKAEIVADIEKAFFFRLVYIHKIEMWQKHNKESCKQEPEKFAFYENLVWHNFQPILKPLGDNGKPFTHQVKEKFTSPILSLVITAKKKDSI